MDPDFAPFPTIFSYSLDLLQLETLSNPRHPQVVQYKQIRVQYATLQCNPPTLKIPPVTTSSTTMIVVMSSTLR